MIYGSFGGSKAIVTLYWKKIFDKKILSHLFFINKLVQFFPAF